MAKPPKSSPKPEAAPAKPGKPAAKEVTNSAPLAGKAGSRKKK